MKFHEKEDIEGIILDEIFFTSMAKELNMITEEEYERVETECIKLQKN